jgi:succinate dehydrogenase / fumarate reductase, cytochrome b subunit
MAGTYRARSIGQALRYRGREGMWTWILHRATGLGILAFLILHVVDTAVVIYWPGFYEQTLVLYKHPVFRIGEFVIFFAVLFHALNGVRIIVQDFWPMAMRHQRRAALAVGVLVLLVLLPVGWMMLGPVAGLREEPGLERHRERMEVRGGEVLVTAPAPAGEGRDAAPVAPVSMEGAR